MKTALSCVSRKEQSFITSIFTGSRSPEPNVTQKLPHNQHDLVQLCVLLNILPSICRQEFHNFFYRLMNITDPEETSSFSFIKFILLHSIYALFLGWNWVWDICPRKTIHYETLELTLIKILTSVSHSTVSLFIYNNSYNRNDKNKP